MAPKIKKNIVQLSIKKRQTNFFSACFPFFFFFICLRKITTFSKNWQKGAIKQISRKKHCVTDNNRKKTKQDPFLINRKKKNCSRSKSKTKNKGFVSFLLDLFSYVETCKVVDVFLGGQKKVGFFGVVVNIYEIRFTKNKRMRNNLKNPSQSIFWN